MWLGVSLEVQPGAVRNNIVTCGHLWKNRMRCSDCYLANGVCYVINDDMDVKSVTKLVPFVDQSKQVIRNLQVHRYALGQVGTSASFSEDGEYLHLGAPGYYQWKGTVVSYALNPKDRDPVFGRPAIPSTDRERHVTLMSYMGYSVTSGKFYVDNVNYVAAGAPRSGNFFGRVYIYKAVKSGERPIVIHQKKEGTQLGEYFGAAVLALNLNNDPYTDLVVGSPFYSTKDGGDEGKVYVFISNGVGLQLNAELNGRKKSNARFGTSIANAGDLNQDEYNDIVIGAPYEDERGAIYVYHGSRAGINEKYAQRVSAAKIDPSLSGFGIHISRGFDIDLNKYPDILVGSYASSNAVLFRSLPVIQLSSDILFSPKQIDTNTTKCIFKGQSLPCLNVTACLWYTGKHVPSNLDFEHEIFVEPSSAASLVFQKRGFFLSNGVPTTVISHQSKLSSKVDHCFTEELYIRRGIQDVITPIQILYRYNIIGLKNRFNKTHPIVDPQVSNNITKAVTFITGCGENDACLSDLSVRADIPNYKVDSALIIGENTTLNVSIEVANVGDPAYMSKLLIFLPPELPTINLNICSEVTEQQNKRINASLVCDIGNPMANNTKVKINIKLDLTQVPIERKEVEIRLEAVTGSTETSSPDNFLNIPLFFKAISDISITGSSSHEQIPYDVTTEGKIPVSISHTYFVMNYGPSPVSEIDIRLFIPTSLQENGNVMDFVTFTSVEAGSGKGLEIESSCNGSYLQINPDSPDVTQKRQDDFTDLESGNSSSALLSSDFNLKMPTSYSRHKRSIEVKSQKKKNVVVNCKTAKCMLLECKASSFIDPKTYAKIVISLQLNLSILNDVLEPWYKMEYVTRGEVVVREDYGALSSKSLHPDHTEVSTMIISSSPPESEEVAQWIIFVSIGIGILLLLIILVLLIKFGFFKREKKKKMEEMRKSLKDRNNYQPCEDESIETDSEITE